MRTFLVGCAATTATVLALGCGGGGGGGGGSSFTAVDGGSAYTGARTAATVDDTSAPDFGDATATGYELGSGINDVALDSSGEASRTARLGRMLFAPAAAASKALQRPGNRRLARSQTETVSGNCGGSVTRTSDVPDNIEFPLTSTGSAVFEAFCEDGTTIEGSVRFIIRVDEEWNAAATETFSGLGVLDEDGRDLVLTGTVSATVENFTEVVLDMNMNVEDRTSDEMAWFDYTVTVTGFGQKSVDIDGSVYHSEHGQVSVTTREDSSLGSSYTCPVGMITSLVHDPRSDALTDGGLLIEGVEGTAAIIEILSIDNGDALDGFAVTVDDEAPIGTFDAADWTSEPTPWE